MSSSWLLTGCTLECNNIRLHIFVQPSKPSVPEQCTPTPRQRKPPCGSRRPLLYSIGLLRAWASNWAPDQPPPCHAKPYDVHRAIRGTSGEGAEPEGAVYQGDRELTGGSGWRGLSFEPQQKALSPVIGERAVAVGGERAVAVGARFSRPGQRSWVPGC